MLVSYREEHSEVAMHGTDPAAVCAVQVLRRAAARDGVRTRTRPPRGGNSVRRPPTKGS